MTRDRTTTTTTAAPGGHTPAAKPDPVEAAATALAAVGPVTAAQLATHLGVAYPTITPRLRRLETDGRAERMKERTTGRTLWHTTVPTRPPTSTAPCGTPADHGFGEPADCTAGEAGHGPDTAPLDNRGTAYGQSTPDTAAQPPAQPAASAGPIEDTPSTDEGFSTGTAVRDKPARRRSGSIATDILAVMRADPDSAFKVSRLSTALPGTSAGAIANSLHKLVIDGSITQVCEKPAAYQAA